MPESSILPVSVLLIIVTYSHKYARYQKAIRDAQMERAEKMLHSGKVKKNAGIRMTLHVLVGKIAVTEEGEAAKIHNYLDTDKIEQESLHDGMYAVTTDLLDDVKDILKVSEGRWEIEECFRIMKTDFEARPVFLYDDVRIKAHFLIFFLSLVIYRYLEKELEHAFTCEAILDKLKTINFRTSRNKALSCFIHETNSVFSQPKIEFYEMSGIIANATQKQTGIMKNQRFPFLHHYEIVHNNPRTTIPMISYLWISSARKQLRP